MELLQIGLPRSVLDAIAIAPLDGTTFALPANATQVEWQTTFTGSPGAISISVQISINGVSFTSVVTSTDTAGTEGNFLTSAQFVRGKINSATGGTTATLILLPKQVTVEL
jgi:hypothetical protein